MRSDISSIPHMKIQRSWALLFTAFLLSFPHLSHAQVQTPRNPNSAKACAICHYRWIDTFFIEGKGSDLVPYNAEKVAASRDMCMSCHDGSIMDSRERLMNDSGHRIDVQPPAAMNIPKIFPLDEGGRMQCATCHTAHGVPTVPDSEETIFLRTSNKGSAMCRMCHPGMDRNRTPGNHPTGVVKQEIPEKLVALGAHAGKKRDALSCETCHTAHGSRNEGFLIESARDSGLCLSCHRDKGIFTEEGEKKPVHVINVKPVKAKIPERFITSGAKLGFNGIITCQSCHKIHGSNEKLLVVKNDQATLCLGCHEDKQYISDTKHNLLHSAPEEKNLQGQTVMEAGVCSACHLPHRAARGLSLGADEDFTARLCLSCHSEGNIAEESRLSGGQHPLNISSMKKWDEEKLTLPLFNQYGLQDKSGKMTCLTCHDPHRWSENSTKGEMRKGYRGDRSNSFLRKPSPEICSSCHREKFYMANSKHDLQGVAPDAKNSLKETPSESGLCGVCHLVHNGQRIFLWAREPLNTDDTALQDLCIGCHQAKGIAGKKTIENASHHVNMSPLRRGLTTTLPLANPGSKNPQDNVIGCFTCHDPHRGNPLKTSPEEHLDVEGSSQKSFLRMEDSPSPKLCGNCHKDKAFIEKTDHDLIVTAPDFKNISGQTPSESGTCGVCHLIHHGSQIRLWGQGLGMGNNVMERMCNFCHSENGPAKDKIPQVYLHPREKYIHNTGRDIKDRPNYFPLFQGKTGALVDVGNISCPSCHNAHQWDPKIFAPGAGVKLEGDATNSFLRPEASRQICTECHDGDAPQRYRFYHDAARRKFRGFEDMFSR